jgi:hypothetical protein
MLTEEKLSKLIYVRSKGDGKLSGSDMNLLIHSVIEANLEHGQRLYYFNKAFEVECVTFVGFFKWVDQWDATTKIPRVLAMICSGTGTSTRYTQSDPHVMHRLMAEATDLTKMFLSEEAAKTAARVAELRLFKSLQQKYEQTQPKPWE